MKLRSALIVAFLAATPVASFADTGPSAAGLWEAKDDDGFTTAYFLFTDRNNVYSARLVKGFKKPGDDKPFSPTCEKCPGDKKGARIMGLTLFWGMKRDGLHYTGGSVLDPRDGSVYRAKMDLSEDGRELKVRGYLMMEMLGKTQTWNRLPDDAMKKEDIPKEVLGNGVVNESGAEKSKPKGDSASTEKPKPKKPKPQKSEASDAAAPDPTSEAAPK